MFVPAVAVNEFASDTIHVLLNTIKKDFIIPSWISPFDRISIHVDMFIWHHSLLTF